jgi:hypothetical protein
VPGLGDNGGARRRGAEGKDRGPEARRTAPGKVRPGTPGGRGPGLLRGPSGAVRPAAGGREEGAGPGTPLRFPFRGARFRRALRFSREMAAPLPFGQPVPAARFARENNQHNNIKKKRIKVKWLQRRKGPRRPPCDSRWARRAGPALPPGSSPASRLQVLPRPSRAAVSFPAFPRGGALRSCPLCSSQQWPKEHWLPKGQMSRFLQEFPSAHCSWGEMGHQCLI